jgi:radical SAM protein with 4Fe4S-binding SPASM domain
MINVSKLYCGLGGQSDDLRYRKGRVVGPVVAYNCTRRCNLRCRHCYSASDAGCGEHEMTTDQAKQFLAQLKDARAPVCLFSGGEPLLRPDLFDLLAEAQRIGLPTVISTNGTQIDASTAQRLHDLALRYVGVSLDGQEPVHDRFRQVQGSFRAALTGIENCRRAGLRTGLRFTVTEANADQVPAVFDIARDTGIRRICFYHLVRSGRAAQLHERGPDRQRTRQVLDTIIDRTREAVERDLVEEVLTVGNHADGPYLLLRMQREGHSGFEPARDLLLANGGNRVGDKIACVAWDGTVYPDQFWRNYPLGNVTERPFREIWSNTADPVLHRLRDKDTFADPRCLSCQWFKLCKGNYRFLDSDPADAHWRNEPACYLTDEEISASRTRPVPAAR